jgi:sulfate adenylyltransferase subunit 1 (EFTu-like GTPase family)
MLLPGRPYLLKIGTRTVTATITEIKHKVNVNTLEHSPPSSWSSTRSACATSA